MTDLNLSPNQMFVELAKEHTPECSFQKNKSQSFKRWKKSTLAKVIATLGEAPPTAPLKPELIAEWEDGELIKQRWTIQVQKHLSAVLLLNKPKGLKRGEKRPAILACHGHGSFGKDPLMGNRCSPEIRVEIDKYNYNFGEIMAQRGFITYAIDWMGFGERNDNIKPNNQSQGRGRDWCNLYYLHATMLGMTPLSINVAHGKAATDFISGLKEVDESKLGVMGLSGGGTMALWMTLADKRFKATEIICYSNLWKDFGIRDINYCGMQISPSLYKLVDLPDLQGLLAPRPLLIDIGINDTCFRVESAMKCYKQLESIYQSAGSLNKLELDLHSGGHQWGDNRSQGFFKKFLA